MLPSTQEVQGSDCTIVTSNSMFRQASYMAWPLGQSLISDLEYIVFLSKDTPPIFIEYASSNKYYFCFVIIIYNSQYRTAGISRYDRQI